LGSLRLQGLSTQSRVKRGHGRADFGRIAAGVGRIQGFGGIKNRTIVGTDRACGLWAVCAFALEGLVQRGAEHFP
jgi:hypothetical protein